MASRFMMRSALVASLVFSTGTTAWAGTVGGISATQPKCTTTNRLLGLCSIEVDSILKQLANVFKNPTAYRVHMFIQEGTIYCYDSVTNLIVGDGVDFPGEGEIERTDTIGTEDFIKNGRTLSEITFHDPEMIAALIEMGALGENAIAAIEQCQSQNENEVVRFGSIILVKAMQLFGQLFTDPTPSNAESCKLDAEPFDFENCTLEDALGVQCTSPIAANPEQQDILDKQLVLDEFSYTCSEICNNPNNLCPNPPQEIFF